MLGSLSTLGPRNRGTYLDKCPTQQLATNLFKVTFKEETKIYIYAAKSQPEISHENVKKFRSMLMQSRKSVERLIGTYAIAGRTVFGSKIQQCGKGGELSLKVEFEGSPYHIFLKLVKEVAISDVHSSDPHKSGIVYSFLNNMLRNFFHQVDYTEIGRSRKYFSSQTYQHLESAKIIVYKGFSSNFSLLESGLFLRMDPAVKIVRSETVLEVINRIYAENSGLTKQEKRNVVERELVGKMVMANYGRNIYHVIESVVFDILIDGYTFHNGKETVNLTQYYKDTYGIELSKKQPLVMAAVDRKGKEDGKEVVLIPELLLMSGLPDDFDERKRREVSELTIVPPSQKMGQIQAIFKGFEAESDGFSPSTVAQKLGIKLETKPTKITAKQLPIPELQLGKRDRIEQHKSTNFMLFNKALFSSSVPLKISVVAPTDFDLGQVKSLMKSTCANLGLEHNLVPLPIKFQDARSALTSIEAIVRRQCEGSGKESTNMFWFIIPSKFKGSYGSIKKIVLRAGVETNSQICLTSTLQKKNFNAILTKVLLQMAAKVGNKLWVPRLSPKLPSSGVLLIGIENYGDTQNKDMNVLSYCSNSNRECSSFFSKYILYSRGDVSKTHMNEIVLNCLGEYQRVSKTMPSDVILIKNGSTKYDNKLMVQTEVAQIKEVFKNFPSHKMQLAYVLLDKDTNQKFFAERGHDVVNPQSGMLVNSQAVGSGFEFYLVAQQCNRGTVRPTFYRVVYSDSGLEEGLIEEMLYGQCFNYMNWTGSIKVPSVIQYAKKLSMFVGQYLSDDCVGSKLSSNLYYI